MTGSAADAEDLTQEAFLKVFKRSALSAASPSSPHGSTGWQ